MGACTELYSSARYLCSAGADNDTDVNSTATNTIRTTNPIESNTFSPPEFKNITSPSGTRKGCVAAYKSSHSQLPEAIGSALHNHSPYRAIRDLAHITGSCCQAAAAHHADVHRRSLQA